MRKACGVAVLICARAGDDLVSGSSGDDAVFGDGGNDRIAGGRGAPMPRPSRDPARLRRLGTRRRAELAVIAGYVLELSRARQASAATP